MTSRLIAALGAGLGMVGVSVYSGALVSGQQSRVMPPAMVVTAFGGKAVEYKTPRTPWGDPDLQGVWSSDDMENIPMAAGQGRGGPGRGGAPQAAPGQAPPLYLDDAALAARKAQVDNAAKQRDTSAESSFRFDYARRVFPQTRLIVDPPDGRLPAIKVNPQERQMPRGTYGPGPAELLGRLLALRALHHARHRGLDPSRHLRQRQPDRPGARRGRVLDRDAARHAHLLHRRAQAHRRVDSRSISVIRARAGKARNWSSRRRTSPTRRRSASTATACGTARRW